MLDASFAHGIHLVLSFGGGLHELLVFFNESLHGGDVIRQRFGLEVEQVRFAFGKPFEELFQKTAGRVNIWVRISRSSL